MKKVHNSAINIYYTNLFIFTILHFFQIRNIIFVVWVRTKVSQLSPHRWIWNQAIRDRDECIIAISTKNWLGEQKERYCDVTFRSWVYKNLLWYALLHHYSGKINVPLNNTFKISFTLPALNRVHQTPEIQFKLC